MNLLDRLVAIWKTEQPGETLPDPKKGMERRTFLKILGGSAAVAVAAPYADLEALIWTPGPVVLAPDVAELGYTFLTPDWVTREALRILEKNLTFAKAIDRDYGDFALNGSFALPIGAEMRIKDARADVIAPIAKFMTDAIDPQIVKGATAFTRPARAGRLAARAVNKDGLVVEAAKSTLRGIEVLRLDVLTERVA